MESGLKSKSTLKKILFRVALVLIIFIILPLIITEVCLRLFWPVEHLKPLRLPKEEVWNKLIHRASSIPGLDYELNPNTEREFNGTVYKINSQGMRDDEPLKVKEGTLYRIVVLGDSFAFGYCTAQKDIFPIVLEKMLNSSTTDTLQRYDVLNYAVDAYSTRQEALILKYKAMDWNPDLVIIGYVLNDPENDPVIPEVSRVYHKTFWWQYSHLLRALYVAKVQWDMKRIAQGDYLKYLHSKKIYKWRSVPRAFKEIKHTTKNKGVKVLVAILPVIPENTWTDYPYRDLHKQVSDAAKKYGFYVMDVLDAWSQVVPASKLWTSPADRHPNKLGHYLIAKAIKEKLAAEHSLFFKERK